MNDEATEVMAKGLANHRLSWDTITDAQKNHWRDQAQSALAALRNAGFELYRPEDCKRWTFDEYGNRHGPAMPEGVYLVVPVSAESPKEGE